LATRPQLARRASQPSLRDRDGTSFWHETYFRRGGFESMYVDTDTAVGMGRFAPTRPATGPMLAARDRANADSSAAVTPG
jgi:hypothetical protein